MKNKLVTALAAVIALFAISSTTQTKVKASSTTQYGRVGRVVAPANMRGKWLYRGSEMLGQDTHKIYKVKITKNQVNGVKLYQADLNITSKYAQDFKKYRFVINQTMNWGQTTIFNRDGIQWLNVNGWTAGAGNGTSYGLVQKTHNGKQTTALAIAVGYKPFIVAYAYRASNPVHRKITITKTDLPN